MINLLGNLLGFFVIQDMIKKQQASSEQVSSEENKEEVKNV